MAPVRTIAIATDGADEADGVIKLAAAIASRLGAELQTISVIEDIVPPGELSAVTALGGALEFEYINPETRARAIEQQCVRVLGARLPTTVRVGQVGDEIDSFARETACGLIVAGRGRHRLAERLLGDEHLPRLLRETSCPVLAASDRLCAVPKRVVVGVDFEGDDFAIARTAMSIAGADAEIHLVHVRLDVPLVVPGAGSGMAMYDDDVIDGLRQLREDLSLRADRAVITSIKGEPSHSLIDYGSRVDADLIAVGTHNDGLIRRLLVGSTTTRLLRSTDISLLAVPTAGVR
jgi:nucleotide-binding universal stress UspA family protein